MDKKNNRQLLELIANQVNILTIDVSELKYGQKKLEREVENIKGIVVRMENNFSEKLGALLNGYVQNAARLDRVEALVAKHEEYILKGKK